MRRLLVLIVIILIVLGIWRGVGKFAPAALQPRQLRLPTNNSQVKVVSEESVTIDAVKNIGPSVVTVVEQAGSVQQQSFNFGPFFIYGGPQQQAPSEPQSIGSGFIITQDGLIVTNKHVVSDTSGKYQIITEKDKKYDVQKIYRDPLNDIAILKIDPNQNSGETLKPVNLGDSSQLQVGQFVIAIGTALGEFKNTVTTGVISGLGRGIQAGDEFQGYVERLDNVIQTSAPINPGNSGGPLVNSSSQVIGVNTAVAQNGQNIGFALPINVIKDSLNNFNQTGQFNRPYLGVAYKFITRDLAIMNDIPSGAYIQSVVNGSPAAQAGLQTGDIVTKIDGKTLDDKDNSLASLISHKKVGDSITLTVWRDGKTQDIKASLVAAPNQ